MTNAEQKRYEGLRNLMDELFPEPDYDLTCTDVDKLSGKILALLPLGKTTRWQNAVYQWSASVKKCRMTSEQMLCHTLLQQAVYVGHAVQ